MDLLQDDLLCGLRGDAREILGDELLGKDVAHLGRLLDLQRVLERDLALLRLLAVHDDVRQEEAEAPLFLVRAHLHVARLALELLLVSRGERARKRIEEHLFADALFPFQIGKRRKEIFIDHTILLSEIIVLRYFPWVFLLYTWIARHTLAALARSKVRSPLSVKMVKVSSLKERSSPSYSFFPSTGA